MCGAGEAFPVLTEVRALVRREAGKGKQEDCCVYIHVFGSYDDGRVRSHQVTTDL